MTTAVALALALVSTTLTSLAYLREHDAAAQLPVLCMRRPIQSARLLLTDRSWVVGFAMETSGFLLYAAALALAPLALVQTIAAGGIGILAYVSARIAHHRLGAREMFGVAVSVVGLVALAGSLAGESGGGSGGTGEILLWLATTSGLALLVLTARGKLIGVAVADGLGGGLLFSLGDVSTKITTQGGFRFLFVVPLILGYTAGTALLQEGYQAGEVLTVAGIATLLTNAVPIAAGTVVLHEPVPSGALGGIRVLSFVAVTIGAVLLGRPVRSSGELRPSGSGPAQMPSR